MATQGEGPDFFDRWMNSLRLEQLFDNLAWRAVSETQPAEEFPRPLFLRPYTRRPATFTLGGFQ